MALPVVALTRPSNIEGLSASQIGASHLTPLYFPGVGHSSLNPAAARAWGALVVACLAATGQTLTAVSTADVLRSFQQQWNAFFDRYTDSWSLSVNGLTNRTQHTRFFQGKTWYLKKGRIPCAVPGTGNHPLGLAVDVAIFDSKIVDGNKWDGGARNIRSDAKVWAWLKENVVSLGWSWEHAAEGVDDPHLRYYAGDKIPQRVLDIEAWIAAASKAS